MEREAWENQEKKIIGSLLRWPSTELMGKCQGPRSMEKYDHQKIHKKTRVQDKKYFHTFLRDYILRSAITF